MTRRYYDLVSASVEIDDSGLQERLDELTGKVDGIAEIDLTDYVAYTALDDRIREYLRDNGYDDPDTGVQDLQERVEKLEGRDADTRVTDLEGKLEGAQADIMRLTERIERLEYTSNVSYNFFALLGKMVQLLLNGPRS